MSTQHAIRLDWTCSRCQREFPVAATLFPPESPGARVESDPTHCPFCDTALDPEDVLVECEGWADNMVDVMNIVGSIREQHADWYREERRLG